MMLHSTFFKKNPYKEDAVLQYDHALGSSVLGNN